MAISDKALIKFCMRLKEINSYENYKLQDKLDNLESLIANDEDFKYLSNKDKLKLFEIFMRYTPNESFENYQNYKYHHGRYSSNNYISKPHSFSPLYYQPIIIFPTCPNNGGSSDAEGKAMALILAIAVVFCALILTIKTIFEIYNNIESIYYDEGRERAIFNLLAIGVIFGGAAYVAATFLFSALIASNPYSLVTFVAAAVTIIFSYLVFWVVDAIADKATPVSIVNPKNPYNNFTMTEYEQSCLEEDDFDSVLARAAIVFINSEIKSPTRLMLCAEKNSEDKKRINFIRDIRQGNIEVIDKYGLKGFNLKKNQPVVYATAVNCSDNTVPLVEAIKVFPFVEKSSEIDMPTPSAPPL